MKRFLLAAACVALASFAPATAQTKPAILLKPARVFDGIDPKPHEGWQVLVEGERITAVGPRLNAPAGARIIDLPGETLMPGMIEGHGHLFLHAYNETSWDDQVLHEALGLRTARAVVHARQTLMAGFTTERDLGTEGAGYADVGLKQAINQGIIPGPRLVVSTRAIVAKGAYGPRGFEPGVEVPLGAEEASGVEDIVRVVRSQIAAGADVIKLYADYRWGPGEPSRPTFSEVELKAAVDAAHDAGRAVAVHAATAEGMRRSIAAGADTIEHGDGGTLEIFKAMKERGMFFCPTLAAVDAISRYRGWNGASPAPASVTQGLAAFAAARQSGVAMCVGGDVGVFPHGDNAREMEQMVAAGMPASQVLVSATSINAKMLRMDDRVGALKPGLLADMVSVAGDPMQDIKAVRSPTFVMKGGEIVRER